MLIVCYKLFFTNKMNMKRTLMMLLLLLTVIYAMAQGTCSYCGGKGRVVKNITTSQYGVRNNYKVKCPTCGAVTLKSSGHTHVTCSHCGGTGRAKSYSSSSRRDSYVTYDPDSPEGMLARSIAKTIRYGIPVSSEEEAAVKRLAKTNATMAKRWMQCRDVLNMGTSYFKECIAKISGKWDNVANVDNTKRMYDNMLSEKAANLQLPNDLYAIYKKYYTIYNNAYLEYRNYTSQFETIRKAQEQIDDYILQQK